MSFGYQLAADIRIDLQAMDPLLQESFLDHVEKVVADPPGHSGRHSSTRHWFIQRSGEHKVVVVYRLLWDLGSRSACVVGLSHEVVPE